MDAAELKLKLGRWREFATVQSRALAAALEALILAGELLPGENLPPERACAASLGVSRTMVVAAYSLLRELGWVQTQQGSGTRISKGPPEYIAATRQRSTIGNPMAQWQADTKLALIELSVTAALPDAAWLSSSSAARAQQLQQAPYQPQGLLALRVRVAERFTRKGIPTTAAQILITSGAQQAISLLAIRYARGKRVILEDPSYFGAIDSFRAAGATLVPVPFASHSNAPQELIRHVLEGHGDLAYVCPTLQNPTGLCWNVNERKALAMASLHTGVLLVVDDTLSDLTFDAGYKSLSHYAPTAPIITIDSISKSLWASLRIGWLRASSPNVEALTGDRLVHDLGSSTLNAAIACDLLDNYDALLAHRIAALRSQRDACMTALHHHLPEWKMGLPKGGASLWIQLPLTGGAASADAFTAHARQFGVSITSGSSLSIAAMDACFIRISYSLPVAICMTGIERLAAAWASFLAENPTSVQLNRR